MDSEDISGFKDMLTVMKKSMRGEQGIQGWEGRSPIHVQDRKPTNDVQKGDLWDAANAGNTFTIMQSVLEVVG